MPDTDLEPKAESAKNPVDLHVGSRMRLRRKACNMTQETLADAMDLTFQQIQKYERGMNRVSASKLVEACIALKVRPAYFFEGLTIFEDGFEEEVNTAFEDSISDFLRSGQGIELARAFIQLPADVRSRILALTTTLAATGVITPVETKTLQIA